MSDAQVRVLPVPEGSIIWLHNVGGVRASDGSAPFQEEMMMALRKAIPHDRYCVLITEGGIVEVLGPDELVERVREVLDAEGLA